MKTKTFTLPAFWACAVVNGDFSGLEDREANEIEAWLSAANTQGYGLCVDVSNQSFFCKWHDAKAYDLSYECLEYTFEVKQ